MHPHNADAIALLQLVVQVALEETHEICAVTPAGTPSDHCYGSRYVGASIPLKLLALWPVFAGISLPLYVGWRYKREQSRVYVERSQSGSRSGSRYNSPLISRLISPRHAGPRFEQVRSDDTLRSSVRSSADAQRRGEWPSDDTPQAEEMQPPQSVGRLRNGEWSHEGAPGGIRVEIPN